MHKPFRFRYANEVAGGFVVLALLLMVGGVFLAGKTKGWFEGKFEMYTTFDIKEGSQGLREGNEVVILDTPAGRVREVVPVEDGSIRATFVINNRFRQYIRKDSVAKVKKKFVAAGDSFIEIEVGSGDPVQDGDFIKCVKDEELMETVQAALKKVEEVFVPMLEEVEDILKNVNSILKSINGGEGAVGAAISDKELALELKDAVTNANSLLIEMKGAFSEATALIDGTKGTVSNVADLAVSARDTFEETTDLVNGAHETFDQATRLIEGAQKVWLWRKHVRQDEESEFLPMISYTEIESDVLEPEYLSRLQEARKADDAGEIINSAYNMGVLQASRGKCGAAEKFITEIRSVPGGKSEFCAGILSAYTADCAGRPEEAVKILESLSSKSRKQDDYLKMQYHLLGADLFSRMNQLEKAKDELGEIKSKIKKTEHTMLKAVDAWISGRIFMMEKNPAGAAGEYDRASGELKSAASYERMAESLRNAGMAYGQAGDQAAAADRCYRAGRGYFYVGQKDAAKDTLSKAEGFASKAEDGDLLLQIKAFCELLEK